MDIYNMIKSKMTMVTVTFFMVTTFFACGGPPSSGKILRIAHGLPVSHPVHGALVYFGKTLRKESGGTLDVVIYPSQQLGSERQILELLQIGIVDIGKVSTSVLEGFVPEYEILGLPYLFEGESHKNAVLFGPIAEFFFEASIPFRLRGLTFYDAGFRSFYSMGKPILHPEDLSGLKVRTQESPVAMNMVTAMGGSATPISWGELYTSLQAGIVDAAENNPPSFYLSRHYEICRYYALDEHSAVPDVVLISTKTYDTLSVREREILHKAATLSARRQKILWDQSTSESLAAVEKAGVKILRPSKKEFRQKVMHLYAPYRKNPSWGHVLDRVKEAGGPADG